MRLISAARIAAAWLVPAAIVVALLPGSKTVPTPATDAVASAAQVAADEDVLPVAAVGPDPLLTSVPAADLPPVPEEPAATADPDPVPVDMPSGDDTATGSVAAAPAAQEEPPGEPVAAQPSFVGSTAVNMRVGPSTDTARLTTLQPGEPVSVIETSDGWSFVQTVTGESGWVASNYLGERAVKREEARQAEASSNGNPNADVEGRTVRSSSAVVVRAGPSNGAERLFVIQPGEAIRIAETRGSWARVIVDGGVSGWVRLRRN